MPQQPTATHWRRCMCAGVWSYALFYACFNPTCQHRRCSGCKPFLSNAKDLPYAIGPRRVQQPAPVSKSTATEHPQHDQRSPARASEQGEKQSPAVSQIGSKAGRAVEFLDRITPPSSDTPGPGTEVGKESVGHFHSEIEDEAQLLWHGSAEEGW